MLGFNTKREKHLEIFDRELDQLTESFIKNNYLEGTLENPDAFLAGLYTVKDKVNRYFPVPVNHQDYKTISLIEQVARGPEKNKTDCRFPALLVAKMIEKDANLDYENGDFVKYGWLNFGKDSVAGAYCRRNYVDYFTYFIENGAKVYIMQNDPGAIMTLYSPDVKGIQSFDSFYSKI